MEFKQSSGEPSNIIQCRVAPNAREFIDRIATNSGKSSAGLVRDWVMERIASLGFVLPMSDEEASNSSPPSDVEKLRTHYRPKTIKYLFVGESAPAGGTFFYQADSHLYYATREAFEIAFGSMPQGAAFLKEFQRRGAWVFDLASRPVNHQRGRPRLEAVNRGMQPLLELLQKSEPWLIIGVKTSLDALIREAARQSDSQASRVQILPFPLYHHKSAYVRQLAQLLREYDPSNKDVEQRELPTDRMPLHKAMLEVFRLLDSNDIPARVIANEIAKRGLYLRADGKAADYQQVVARAHRYPKLFECTRSGIRLNASES